MKIIQGQGVSKGIEQGTIYFYHRAAAQVEMRTGADEQEERSRLERAKERTAQQLSDMAEKAREEAGDEAAVLFETHAMFLEDEDYMGAMDELLSQGFNAEYAVDQAGQEFAAMLASMEDPYMQARAADIKDVTGRILNNLMGVVEGGIDSQVPVILAADDLAPSETIQLDKSKILAIATQKGSGNSHTAILARTMGIPAVCGLGEDFNEDFHGKQAYIVGETGQLILEPDEETLVSLKARHAKQEETRELMRSMVGQEDVTLDGKRVHVYCNIGSPEDVASVLANDGQGIGLFRSEFLFMDSAELPSEEEQFNAYRKVASALKGAPVIIRTLDVGGDKEIPYLHMVKEDNPFMGFRAVRYCLANPDQYKVQLRALLRASAFGDVKIMIPLVTCVEEVLAVKELVEQCKAELSEEGRKFNENIEVGIMVETPAASLLADRLAEVADFFSIGTNDLIGYTMCADRGNDTISNLYQVYYPAVLRSLKNIIESGVKAGIMVGMCGEAAADPLLEPLLISWGLEEFSMSAPSILRARKTISQWTKAECDELAEKALACNTAAEVKALLESAAR